MDEGDAALARHLRQQAKAFDPQGDGDEMRRQDQLTPLCLWRSQHRQDRDHHRKQPDGADGDGNRRLHGRSTGAERRNQDDLRRTGPYQQRAQERPAEAEMRVMRKRPDAEIGRKQHRRQNRRRDRAHPPCERPPGTLPIRGVKRREGQGQPEM